jgi:hypothetical protein
MTARPRRQGKATDVPGTLRAVGSPQSLTNRPECGLASADPDAPGRHLLTEINGVDQLGPLEYCLPGGTV